MFFSRFLRRTKPVDVLGPADGVGVGRPPVVGTAAAAADHLRENRGFVIVDEIELMGTLFSHVSGAFKGFFGNDGLVMIQNPVLHELAVIGLPLFRYGIGDVCLLEQEFPGVDLPP